jgi:drug/metabolite transporter (DMT)-like permease
VQFWVVAALVGIFGFGFSFVLYNAAIVFIAAGPAGVIINLSPAFGLTGAVLLLGETLTAARAIGAALIGLSVILFVCVERAGEHAGHETAAQPVLLPRRGAEVP